MIIVGVLSLLAWIYGRVTALRNHLYDKGILDVHDLGARVISVGNITVGGTGKTPLVAYVARELAGKGEKVCILTRGYGRDDESKRVLVSDSESVLVDSANGGDEPVELAAKLLGKAIVIADADRVGAAEWARRKFGSTTFVLDDGLQHRKVKRDVDIVCVDATDPFGNGKLLPAGRLRESVTDLARADIIVITRVDLVSEISDLRSHISHIAPAVAVVECHTKIARIAALSANDTSENLSKKRRVFAFCGIGNPESFFSLLRQNDLEIRGTKAFRDHHRFTQTDIEEIERLAHDANADALITTAKDAVKLSEYQLSLPCFIAEIDIELSGPLLL